MKLHRITIDTNPDTCNLKCKMCDTHSIYNKDYKKTRPDMPLELLEIALKGAKNAGVKEIIPTTMGEPTLYKYFENIVEFCKDNDIKLNLTTNGSQLFSKRYDETYIKEKLLAVLSDIKISFNSLDSKINESIMYKSDTESTIKRIERFCLLRDMYNKNVSITLQMTFMRSNLDSIIPLIEYAIKKGINRIKGHQLWITHKELESEALHTDETYKKKWNALVESLVPYRDKIRLENFMLFGDESIDSTTQKQCPFLGKELWINYKGDISVCCAPDNLRKELGDFGNIKNSTLLQVLESTQYQNLVESYQTKEVCKQCLLKK